MAVAPV
jgi:hypothetical protein